MPTMPRKPKDKRKYKIKKKDIGLLLQPPVFEEPLKSGLFTMGIKKFLNIRRKK
jgi:hypothetical protein